MIQISLINYILGIENVLTPQYIQSPFFWTASKPVPLIYAWVSVFDCLQMKSPQFVKRPCLLHIYKPILAPPISHLIPLFSAVVLQFHSQTKSLCSITTTDMMRHKKNQHTGGIVVFLKPAGHMKELAVGRLPVGFSSSSFFFILILLGEQSTPVSLAGE